MQLPFTRTRLGILAGVLGATGALTFVAASAQSEPLGGDRSSDEAPGDISGPCDEAEHAGDPECAGVAPTRPDTTPTAPTTPTTARAAPAVAAPAPAAGTHSLPTPGGTVTYRANGTSITLVRAMPAGGWRVEVEQSSGREVELDFRAGSRRVQVNLEIEDGRVRERVRLRNDATGLDVRTENGVVVANDHDGSTRSSSSDPSGSNTSGSASSGSSGSSTSGSGSSGSGSSGSAMSGSGSSGSGSSGGPGS